MNDLENDLLDEIYFVQSYKDLAANLGWNDDAILETLVSLYAKQWIRCYKTPTEEILSEEIDLESDYKKYYYLASKKGLFAHNSTE
jgi:hypothetical protein